MKNLYIAVQAERAGLYYATVLKVSDSENLVSVLERIPGIISANVWPKAEAESAVSSWNEGFKKEGVYLYG